MWQVCQSSLQLPGHIFELKTSILADGILNQEREKGYQNKMVLTLLREAKVRTWDRLTKTLMQLNLRAAITVGHNHKCLGKTQIYEVAYSCGNKKISTMTSKLPIP